MYGKHMGSGFEQRCIRFLVWNCSLQNDMKRK